MLQPVPRLARLLSPAGHAEAVDLLRMYFAPRPAGRPGGYFERIGQIGAHPDEITPEDLVAAGTLGVVIPGDAALAILVDHRDELSRLLARLPTDVAFADLSVEQVESVLTPKRAYRLLTSVPGIGTTAATVLLARKRPHLVPILEPAVVDAITGIVGLFLLPLRELLTADDRAYQRRLDELHDAAGLAPEVSALRVLHVLARTVGEGADR